jgi:hypothetical protein
MVTYYHGLHHHGQWVIQHWTGHYLVRVDRLGGVTAVEQRSTREVLFVLLHDARNGDRRARGLLCEIHGALYPEARLSTLDVGTSREFESAARIADAVERAAAMGQVAIVPEVRPAAQGMPKPLLPALGPSELTPQSVHFIELELVDQDEKPVGGEAYSIKLPDGRTVNGKLDNNGRATVNGIKNPGSCQVSFPNLDVSVWG